MNGAIEPSRGRGEAESAALQHAPSHRPLPPSPASL